MIKNYFKIAIRNLAAHKLYSCINILGLAVGVFCCILIMLYVLDELSYDRFHEKSDRIHRVAAEVRFGGNHFRLAVAPAPMAQTLREDYPEVVQATRFRERGGYLVRNGDKVFREDQVIYADSTLFDVFSFDFTEGDPKTALARPNTVVLTRQTAQKYFGSESPIGKTLQFDGGMNMEVTGVVKELPHNSHFHFSMYMSMATIEESRRKNWVSNNFNTYILLAEGTDPASFEAKLDQVIENYVMPQAFQLMDITREEFDASGNKVEYYLQPLTDIHLHSDLTAELAPNGSIQYVYIFSAIAVFVLLIACINFMNLSTARSAGRAQEVGVRKVLGSDRGQLVGQFLFETIILSFIAFILAAAAAQLAIPYFNELSGKQFGTSALVEPQFVLIMFAAAIAVGILAGMYPALFLSGFEPAKALKGMLARGTGSRRFRSGLVVFQFTISVVLFIGTLVIYRQLKYVQQKNLGYAKEQVMITENAYGLGDNLQVFKENMTRRPEIASATVTSYLPTPSARSDTPFFTGAQMTNDNSVSMQYWAVDYDYIQTMKMNMVKGRNFFRDMGTDSSAIIINRRAARMFGFENPIGKEIHMMNSFTAEAGYTTYRIIGVVENFHYESLRQNIGALALYLGQSNGYVALRFRPEDVAGVVAAARSEWEKLAPGQPFNFTFLDDRFDAVYRSEQRMGTIVAIFSAFSVFVACLGLFAMAAFTAERRTREIGIRKVLGASVADIVRLLSQEYVKLVLAGFVVALPLAWLAMNRWLQDFAYRTDLNAGIFIGAGLLTMVVALLTVSWQSVRAALANPVESLRSK